MNQSERASTSPWAWIGCGCGAIVLVIVCALGAMAYFGWRAMQDLQAGFENPEGREAAVERVLHPRSLPEGYHPIGGLHIPFLVDLAILSHRLPEEAGDDGIGERAFIFLEVASFLYGGESEWEEDLGFLDSSTIQVRRGEQIGRGSIELDRMVVHYSAFRGEIDVDGGRQDGIVNLLYLRCHEPPDNRHRFAIWVGPDPAPERDAVELDTDGTPADEEAVRAFLAHFEPCS